jgi:Concanavalin A-like lectin/glucanases superfamily/Immunoglobulin domain
LGHGAVHWSGNFDEIQDFEHDIRGPFGGTGFLNLSPQQFTAQHPSPASGKTGLSGDLDALAAYVSSLTPDHTPRSPSRNANGTFTDAAVRGQAVFAAQNCASCHSGASFTNGTLVDVGTQSSLSGSRLGMTLPGIDTPTLHGLHATHVYLHHGQAATLGEVFSHAGGTWIAGTTGEFFGGGTGAFTDVPAEGGGGFNRGYFNGSAAFIGGADNVSGVRFTNVDGGSGGTARLSLRYLRQYGGGTSYLRINGVSQTIATLRQEPDMSWNTGGWRWLTLDVPLNPGATNTIELLRGNGDFFLNGLLIANATQLLTAQPHRLVQGLSSADRGDLLAYLTQIDGRDASGVPLAAPSAPSPQAPGIVSEPQSLVLAEGNALNFAVSVSGTGPFTYEWRRGITVVGTNSAELHIAAVSLADAGGYTCTITNAQGSIVTTPALLTVNGPLTITTSTLTAARLEQDYHFALSATGGISTRTWSIVSGVLPPGITLSSGGVLSGTPTAAGRADITVQVSDASGSDAQALTLDAQPVGGFVNDPDLILHYTFDEGSGTQVWDSATGGNNHLTTVTNAHWISTGRFGGAYGPSSMDAGVNNFLPANQSDLNLDPRAQAYTFSIWCRTTTTSAYNILIGKDNGGSGNVQHRLWMTPGANLQVVNGDQYGASIPTTPALNDGQWHLVTMVNFNDAGTWRTRVYYDAVQISQFNTGAGGTVADALRVGGMSAGWNGWIGQIDDLRIYRRALTQEEILSLHTAPNPETYGTWSAANLPPASAAPDQDANGNGIPNLIEFIAPQPLAMQLSGGNAILNLTRNSAARGVTLIVEYGTDLTIWTPLATSINGNTPTGTAIITEGTGIVRPLNVQHAAPPGRAFYRVRAVMD